MTLGAAFTPAPVALPEIDLNAWRLEAILEALEALRDTIQNTPVPQVHVEPPDLSAIVYAVEHLKREATPEEIARAVTTAIAPSKEPADLSEQFTELLGALKKLDVRLANSAAPRMPGGLLSDVRDRPDRVLGHVVVDSAPSIIPSGTFDYTAGQDGTVTLSGSKKVQQITAHCTTAGSLTINGGAAITIPANSTFAATYADGKLTDPTLVFTGTDAFYVDWLE